MNVDDAVETPTEADSNRLVSESSHGAGTLQTLVDSLGAHGEKTALLALTKQGREQWSYRELSDRAHSFAYGLVRAGVRPGDSIVLFAESRPEWIAASLGVLRAGAVVAPIDVQFSDNDLAHVLSDSEARAVVTTQRRAARMAKLAGTARLIALDNEQIWRADAIELPLVRSDDLAVL